MRSLSADTGESRLNQIKESKSQLDGRGHYKRQNAIIQIRKNSWHPPIQSRLRVTTKKIQINTKEHGWSGALKGFVTEWTRIRLTFGYRMLMTNTSLKSNRAVSTIATQRIATQLCQWTRKIIFRKTNNEWGRIKPCHYDKKDKNITKLKTSHRSGLNLRSCLCGQNI